MFRLFDVGCATKDCENNGQIVEILHEVDDLLPNCSKCDQPMIKMLTYSLGKVQRGTPKFHRNSKHK